MMEKQFSKRVRDVIGFSKEEAHRLGHEFIGTEHFILGILRNRQGKAIEILNVLGINLDYLRKRIEALSPATPSLHHFASERKNLPLTNQSEKALKFTVLEAKSLKCQEIDTAHLLLCVLRNENDPITKLFKAFDIDYKEVKRAYNQLFSENDLVNPFEANLQEEEERERPSQSETSKSFGKKSQKSNTPVLDNFGRDLTKLAEQGELDPVVGREKEIERVSQILSRRKKNNPILIGEPGVGKSAIAEGLSLRIVQRKVSRILFDKRVISLDLASLVAGTKYRGQFEERMKALMNELKKNDDIILFIDEIHTIVGAGGATGSLDASNMLKPALARGEIQCVGATTLDEYRTNIEKDGALERRFQKVLIEPTSIDETIQILHNIKDKYEEHHNVEFTDEAIEACVKLTSRYMTDRYLPDKAIDAMDEAGSRIHINNIVVPKEMVALEKELETVQEEKTKAVNSQQFEKAASFRDKENTLKNRLAEIQQQWEEDTRKNRKIVTEENVAEVVSMMTGIPVNRVAEEENKRLSDLPDRIKGKVIGQDEAVAKVVKAIQRNRVGLKDPNKPIGSFIFLGQTGVGKTQLAKILALELFDSNDSLVRIDMSEYMEKFAVSRLIGAPPGYVGYEEGGQLTEKIRRKPYAIVLLDEIEKAHPDVFNMLLQILDDGFITDSLGRKVDFRNTVIIMTSNIGSRQLKDFGTGVGFGTASKKSQMDAEEKRVIQNALKKSFAPEFLNRIDDVIVFNSLEREHIHQIISIELEKLKQRVKGLGYELKLTQEAMDYIADKGFDKQYGARPLKRAIQKYVEDILAEEIVNTNIKEGDIIAMDLDKKEEVLKIKIEHLEN
ncbi:MAG: ATP-dependent Clp protease ATP-binding subunit [Flavobacteriaceae bacterium]|nr:ATP-dependent Clp protease ATP-binding subunit [Flavobacteriaceae bacterium]